MIKFWFNYVFPNREFIERENSKLIFDFPAYFGRIFEDFIKMMYLVISIHIIKLAHGGIKMQKLILLLFLKIRTTLFSVNANGKIMLIPVVYCRV